MLYHKGSGHQVHLCGTQGGLKLASGAVACFQSLGGHFHVLEASSLVQRIVGCDVPSWPVYTELGRTLL